MGQEVFGMVLARTSLRAPAETSRWHLEKGDLQARPDDRRILPQATVSKAVRVLLQTGLLEEGQLHQKSDDGRPVMPLRFGRNLVIAGVHIEQRRNTPCAITVALVGLDSSLVFKTGNYSFRAPSKGDPWSFVAEKIHLHVLDLLSEIAEDRVCAELPPVELFGVGVEVGAPVHRGRVMPVPGSVITDPIDFTGTLHKLFSTASPTGSAVPVVVENDVNALAVLAIHQAHYSVSDLVVVGVYDEGVGGGLVMDGRLRRGGNGTAMELGHLPIGFAPGESGATQLVTDGNHKTGLRRFEDPCWCGRLGHVDTRTTPSRICGELGLKLSGFAGAARSTSPEAKAAFSYAGSVLGRAIAHVCNIVDPSRLVIFLPAPLLECADSDATGQSSAGSDYVEAARHEIKSAFANAGRDVNQYLTFQQFEVDPTAGAFLGARAAAVCVLESFIEHALRVDGCRSTAQTPRTSVTGAA